MLWSANENRRLLLTIASTQKALNGQSNVFDEVTYIRISLCELCGPRDTLNSPTSAKVNTAKRFRISTTPGGP